MYYTLIIGVNPINFGVQEYLQELKTHHFLKQSDYTFEDNTTEGISLDQKSVEPLLLLVFQLRALHCYLKQSLSELRSR